MREKFLKRPRSLRHLRLDQWFRYIESIPKYQARFEYKRREERLLERKVEKSGHRGYTHAWRAVHDVCDDETHIRLHPLASQLKVGQCVNVSEDEALNISHRRRPNKRAGYLRAWRYRPANEQEKGGRTQRDHVFESRLFRSLPWYEVSCQTEEEACGQGAKDHALDLPLASDDESPEKHRDDGAVVHLSALLNEIRGTRLAETNEQEDCDETSPVVSSEHACMALENRFQIFACNCSAEAFKPGAARCATCHGVNPIGFHWCEKDS